MVPSGLLDDDDYGLVTVHGLASFAWDAGWSCSAPGKAVELVMALIRRHATARSGALGLLYIDGACPRLHYGTRQLQRPM